MASLCIRKNFWDSLSRMDQATISTLDLDLTLGNPAEFKASNTSWLVFDDHRFTVSMIARLGVVFANLTKMNNGRASLDADVVEVDVTEGEDRLEAVLRGQGAPSSARMGIGESWKAVGGDEL